MSSYSVESSQLYDLIYTRMKNYGEEAEKVRGWLQRLRPEAESLLDIACGTGEHARHLKASYRVEGLDLSPGLLDVARAKNPDCVFHQADMADFDLGRRFDVVMSLFSSIGYVRTRERLGQTVRCLARHLNEGGLLLVEPWFTPDAWQAGKVHMVTIDEPELKVVRMSLSETRGACSYFRWHFLVGTGAGVEHFTEDHELGLFSREDMTWAFTEAGLQVRYDEAGIFGRGLYLAE